MTDPKWDGKAISGLQPGKTYRLMATFDDKGNAVHATATPSKEPDMEEQAIELPPLPDPSMRRDHIFDQQLRAFTPREMQAYARAAVLAERERCARILDECAAQAYERNAMRENVMWVSLAADMRSGK
jgi:hypothetical protein